MEKAKKSRLSDKQKKAINITVITVEILIVILAIAFSVSILLSTGYETSTDFGDASVRLMPVLTGSMSGDNPDSFDEGDLIIVNKATPERIAELEVGDIITYAGNVGGGRGFITHRIVDVEQFTNSLGDTYRRRRGGNGRADRRLRDRGRRYLLLEDSGTRFGDILAATADQFLPGRHASSDTAARI